MKSKTKLVIALLAGLFSSATPGLTLAGYTYKVMETIPGFINSGDCTNFNAYIAGVYKFGIWVVGIAALLMLSIGAFMYLTSAGNKAAAGSAKNVITDAIVGLIMALTAYFILYQINPDLVSPPGIDDSTSSCSASAATTAAATTTTTTTTPTTSSAGTGDGTCGNFSTQVSKQCGDASSSLNSLLSCMNEKLGNTAIVSSISDGNGGANCYSDHPTWSQCPSSGGSNCCYHKKGSCHYGGTCSDGSHAADFSSRSSSSTSEISSAAQSCGGKALVESNPPHVHVSVGSGCGCN